MRTGSTVVLDNGSWTLSDELGHGGFGEVYRGHQGAVEAAIKFIPKSKGVPREILLDIPKNARNVIPITGTGEDADNWIISMPVADHSLEKMLNAHGGKLPEDLAVMVLTHIAEALASLDGSIVHRDIKPGNILLFNAKWCLTDFGIARYAAAATGSLTHKGYGTAAYVAPELWLGQSATSQSDIYALGIVAYEIITGSLPFQGTEAEIAHGHLNVIPPSTGAPARLDWVILDSLSKPPSLRPTAEQFKVKLSQRAAVFNSKAAMAMGQANHELRSLEEQAEQRLRQAVAEAELRQHHVDRAGKLLSRIGEEVLTTLQGFADRVQSQPQKDGGGKLTFHKASLMISPIIPNTNGHLMAQEEDPFVVLATAHITLWQFSGVNGYPGRSHALWYADAKEEGNFQWYETAFIQNGGMQPTQRFRPFAAEFESREATAALRGEGNFLVAWPFAPLDADDLDEFIERWGVWFAQASKGELQAEQIHNIGDIQDSWRKA
ncbi:serine/threonine protein kinase [Arthrobacter sp. FB24]|uniref:serine/threonine-protein kinase n=1 Tax=Arthrobacter sp. (strain FB24) TaxID=290399 RepID=UPI000052709B|nr:serine/threonine-protein kinase [Arthrobacter sp. FB24]ABK02399.1 serine/threonine protein kinase [Arthrobacter sp. FB24]